MAFADPQGTAHLGVGLLISSSENTHLIGRWVNILGPPERTWCEAPQAQLRGSCAWRSSYRLMHLGIIRRPRASGVYVVDTVADGVAVLTIVRVIVYDAHVVGITAGVNRVVAGCAVHGPSEAT